MTSRVRTFGRRLTFGAMVATVALVATPVAASAHSELVSSDPAADTTVAKLPDEVILTFNEPVQESGSSIVVTAGAQEISQSGTFAVDETSASVEIDGADVTGAVEVAFRIVSEDGHVVRDTYSFDVSGGGATAPPDDTPTPEPSPPTDDGSGGTIVWVLGLGAIGLVLVAALVAVGMRGRRGPSS